MRPDHRGGRGSKSCVARLCKVQTLLENVLISVLNSHPGVFPAKMQLVSTIVIAYICNKIKLAAALHNITVKADSNNKFCPYWNGLQPLHLRMKIKDLTQMRSNANFVQSSRHSCSSKCLRCESEVSVYFGLCPVPRPAVWMYL